MRRMGVELGKSDALDMLFGYETMLLLSFSTTTAFCLLSFVSYDTICRTIEVFYI